jgi:anti-anti-sigma regulatory factor
VDLSETTFIDASVLGAFVRAGHRLAAEESRLKIFGASGMVADLLALTKIDVEYGADMRVPDATASSS